MELSSKQRAYLRSLSNDLDVIVHIGKDGIGENLVKQANDALEARIEELILQDEELPVKTHGEIGQVMSGSFAAEICTIM